MKRSHVPLCMLAVAFVAVVSFSCKYAPGPDGTPLIYLAPEPTESAADFQSRVRTAFNLATPGTIFEFGAGTYEFTAGFTITASHVTVRGQGMTATILDFSNATDSNAFLARGDEFLIHDLKIWDPPGNGVKAESVDGVTFRRLWVEWAEEASSDNGPYGIYPVSSQNILVELCYIKGAEDTGIYVGQSDKTIVRWNYLEGNVAGIEIENTTNSDVHHNIATGNTAGILVFNDPGIARFGHTARVFSNWLYLNNGPNFGSSPLLTLVPPGMGILLMAMDNVEIYDNDIWGNVTSGIALISFEMTLLPYADGWDVWPERIDVHDNRLNENSDDPVGTIAAVIALQFGTGNPLPDMWWDRLRNPDYGLALGDLLPEDLRICVHDNVPSANGDPVWGVLGDVGDARYDLSYFDCEHPSPGPVLLRDRLPLPEGQQELSPEETAALCGAETAGVNWAAVEASCPNLSDYNLFATGDPRGPVSERGVLYDLTTPLFSDYSIKHRFVFVPPGQTATYDDQNVFDFPVGTIVSKTFSFDLPGGGQRVVETRLLVRRAGGWKALVYLWDEAMTEATFVPGGAIVPIDIVVTDGSQRSIVYQVPDVNQCGGCHTGFAEPMHLIGPKARLLNKPDPGDATGTTNQLVTWNSVGILDSLVDPSLEPRLPVWDDDTDGTLNDRARAYLESNCAHCHRPEGRAGFTNLWLHIDQPEGFNLGICKHPIAAGSGSFGKTFDIVPGMPDESILALRLDSATPSLKMPELAKATVHDEGVALVRDWIAGLPGDCTGL